MNKNNSNNTNIIFKFFNRCKNLIYNSSFLLSDKYHKFYLLLFSLAVLYRFFLIMGWSLEDRGSIILFLVTLLASFAISLYVLRKNKVEENSKTWQYIQLIIYNFLLGLIILSIFLFVIYYFEFYTVI